jgi:hypothetical protein
MMFHSWKSTSLNPFISMYQRSFSHSQSKSVFLHSCQYFISISSNVSKNTLHPSSETSLDWCCPHSAPTCLLLPRPGTDLVSHIFCHSFLGFTSCSFYFRDYMFILPIQNKILSKKGCMEDNALSHCTGAVFSLIESWSGNEIPVRN